MVQRRRDGRSAQPVPPAPEALEVAALDGGEELVLLSFPLRAPVLGPPTLTAAETAVARLAIRGYGNSEIARRRGRAARTVANQLASIYRKLAVGSRAELVARLHCHAFTAPPGES